MPWDPYANGSQKLRRGRIWRGLTPFPALGAAHLKPDKNSNWFFPFTDCRDGRHEDCEAREEMRVRVLSNGQSMYTVEACICSCLCHPAYGTRRRPGEGMEVLLRD